MGSWDIKPKWTQVGPRTFQADVIVNTGYLPGPRDWNPVTNGVNPPLLRGTVELVHGKKVVETASVMLSMPYRDFCVSHEAQYQAKLEAKAKADAKAKAELEAKTKANLAKSPFIVSVVGYEPPIEFTPVPGCAGGSRFVHETRNCGAVSKYKGNAKTFVDYLNDAIDTIAEGFDTIADELGSAFVTLVKGTGEWTGLCTAIDAAMGAGSCASTLGDVGELAAGMAVDGVLSTAGIPPSVPNLHGLIDDSAAYFASDAVDRAWRETGAPMPEKIALTLSTMVRDGMKGISSDLTRLAGLQRASVTMGTMWYREPICEEIYGIDWGSEPEITTYIEVQRRADYVGDLDNWTIDVGATGYESRAVGLPRFWPMGTDKMIIPVVLRANFDLVAPSVTSILGSDWRTAWMNAFWKSGTGKLMIRATAFDSDRMSHRSESCTDTAGIGCANVFETTAFTSSGRWGKGKAPTLLPDCDISQLGDWEKEPLGL